MTDKIYILIKIWKKREKNKNLTMPNPNNFLSKSEKKLSAINLSFVKVQKYILYSIYYN